MPTGISCMQLCAHSRLDEPQSAAVFLSSIGEMRLIRFSA